MFGWYKHYKGGHYFVIGVGRLSEDRDKKMVIYWSFSKWCFWLRPLEMFMENVTLHLSTGLNSAPIPYRTVPRFKKVIGF